AWMTFQGLRRFDPGVAEDIYLFRFAQGVDPAKAISRLKQTLPDIAVTLGVSEGEIGNLKRVSNLPIVLAGLLGLIAIATFTHTLVTVVRRRSRVFAILKTIGLSRTQIRAAVAWQATALVVIT